MPIKGISDVVRIPRLGKLRLGIKVEEPGKAPYPKATEFFVCPKVVQDVYGPEPKELEIMFPTEDPDQFAQQWLRAYSSSQGLNCIGDGETCRRKMDKSTGAIAGKDTRDWLWKDGLECNPDTCQLYQTRRCRRVMNLQVILPKVAGLGIWQIDTTSREAIINLNNTVNLLRSIGRVSMIPLTMFREQVEVTPPGETKKKVWVINFTIPFVLGELARMAQLPAARVLWPVPEIEEAPEDLYPSDMLIEAEKAEADEQLQMGWEVVKSTLKTSDIDDSQIANWFRKHYNVEASYADFTCDDPPSKFTAEMMSKLVDSLETYKEKQL